MEDQSYDEPVYTLRDAVYEGNLEDVRKLLDAGVPVNAHDSEGGTALMWAADEGREDIVALLLARGADVNARDRAGWTPLLLAANTNRLRIVSLLLPLEADTAARTNNGTTVDDIAQRNKNPLLTRLLSEHERG